MPSTVSLSENGLISTIECTNYIIVANRYHVKTNKYPVKTKNKVGNYNSIAKLVF